MATDAVIEVDGLKESLTALRRFDDATKRAVPKALRDGAAVIRVEAQDRLGGRPGGGSYPRRRGMIRSGAQAARASAYVGYKASALARYPWALGAEFGANRAWVFGRVTLQSELSRRQFPTRNPTGWIVAPAVVDKVPEVEELIVALLDAILTQALDRAGVPRSKGA